MPGPFRAGHIECPIIVPWRLCAVTATPGHYPLACVFVPLFPNPRVWQAESCDPPPRRVRETSHGRRE